MRKFLFNENTIISIVWKSFLDNFSLNLNFFYCTYIYIYNGENDIYLMKLFDYYSRKFSRWKRNRDCLKATIRNI